MASLHGLRLTFLYNGASAEHAIATLKQTSSDRGVAQQRNELRPCVHPRSQPAARRVRPLRTPGPLHTGDRGLPLPANARSIQDLTRPPHPLVMGAGSRTSARPPPDLTEKPRRLPPPKRGDAQPQAPERRELLDEERPPAHVRLAKAARYVHDDTGEALPTHSFPRLILPLLAVSGRHFGELVNGRSTFAPTTHPHYTLFSGQLKKRGTQLSYQIPLLVPLPTFAKLLPRARSRTAKYPHLTNAQATARNLPNVQRELEAGGLPSVPITAPIAAHVQDCRWV